jgi:hypothetical protein
MSYGLPDAAYSNVYVRVSPVGSRSAFPAALQHAAGQGLSP